MKNIQVKYGPCDIIVFPNPFSFENSKLYLIFALLTAGSILLTGPGIYPQIYHRVPCPAVFSCREGVCLVNNTGEVGLFQASKKERLFHLL